MDITVIVPTFNEEQRIENTIKAIHTYMRRAHLSYETVIVDDASTDATPEIAKRFQQEKLPLTLVCSKENKGKGYAVRRGVAVSTGDLILITDADLATPIEDLDKLLEKLQAGFDIAIGSRALSESRIVVHQPAYREWLGKAFNRIVQVLLLPGISDTQCGFKLFRGALARRLFAQCTVNGFAFDVEVLSLAARAKYKIVEVPVRWAHVEGSKVRPAYVAIEMFWDAMKIAYRLGTNAYRDLNLASGWPRTLPTKPLGRRNN